ncbi:MAG: 1-(5-phosphoribosyl)-5-[(5-phosphoribosylamino)methylideneamino]imidazole-4-carboxamide isomerase [Actinomycetes bacterium]|nr:1-(5-phosphoribosyl)-5-[(5-phosphoribosylamino)methylideneamino]imidazole-4-carboxamide isomerase [Actinomycetes bacterium]
MYLLPAIDILDGRAVRLARGDYDQVTVYHEDPVAQARAWRDAGARYLHIVDLDGARTGFPENLSIIEHIAHRVGVPIEVGGGIRHLETIEALLRGGVDRVILGTKLANEPAFVQTALEEFGEEHLVAGIDARDGMVHVDGWVKATDKPAGQLVSEIADWGIRHLVYTDIARDGMQTGVNADMYRGIAAAAGFPVVASGGVATLDDIAALAAAGPRAVEGIICGRALYEDAFTIEQANAVLRDAGVLTEPVCAADLWGE